MGNTIKFGVYKNPSKDANGKESYHVRHETNATLNDKYIADHVAHYNEPEAPHIKGVVSVLKKNIVEILTDNRNVHIEGLGNFYLKLGFRTRTDENGQEVKPHFTDPAKITGNDIVVKGIGFTPDEEFLKELFLSIQENPKMEVEVDLPNQTVTNKATGRSEHFDINGYKKHCLMNGLDDIDFLVQNKEKTELWEQQNK